MAVLLAVPCGLLCSANIVPWWVYQPMRRLMDAARAINEMVFAMLFVVAVGLGRRRRRGGACLPPLQRRAQPVPASALCKRPLSPLPLRRSALRQASAQRVRQGSSTSFGQRVRTAEVAGQLPDVVARAHNKAGRLATRQADSELEQHGRAVSLVHSALSLR